MKLQLFSKKYKTDELRKIIDLNQRTYESKLQTIQGAFETLRQQNEEIKEILRETVRVLEGKDIKILKEMIKRKEDVEYK